MAIWVVAARAGCLARIEGPLDKRVGLSLLRQGDSGAGRAREPGRASRRGAVLPRAPSRPAQAAGLRAEYTRAVARLCHNHICSAPSGAGLRELPIEPTGGRL